MEHLSVVKDKRIRKTPVIISERDDEILHAVYTYRYLTALQVTRLFYSKGSLKYVRDNLGALVENGYLYRFNLPTTTLGKSPYVYTLASKGIKYLKSLDVEDMFKFRPSVEREVSYQHIHHTLSLNDMLIAAALLTKDDTTISISDLRHEWFLKHTPLSVKVTVEAANGKKIEQITVVPDAFVHFRFPVQGKYHSMPIWVELDRGTEAIKQFKRKIRGLLAVIDSVEYEQLFHTKGITIAFATTANGTRLANMRSWVKQELTELGKLSESSLFLFTKLPEGELDPKSVYLSSTWYLADDDSPVSLLDLS